MASRRNEIKAALFARSNGLCSYCGKPLSGEFVKIDHIIPFSSGGSDDLGNLTLVCAQCNAQKAARHYTELVTDRVNHRVQFQGSMETIKLLLQVETRLELKASLNRLLFSNAISAMETYLSDKLISSVMADSELFKRTLETNLDFKKEKISLSEIINVHAGIREHVQNYLSSQVYHRLEKIKPMYESIFNISFPNDLDAIFSAITVRHDIVHRNGKDKSGNYVCVLENDVLRLIDVVSDFIFAVDGCFSAGPHRIGKPT